jgi:hypothetical protein
LRLTYALHEYHTHHTQSHRADQQQEDAQFRWTMLTGDLAKSQNELAAKREQFDALSQQKQRIEYELVQAGRPCNRPSSGSNMPASSSSRSPSSSQSFERTRRIC